MTTLADTIKDLKRKNRPVPDSNLNWENLINSLTDMLTVHDNNFNIIYANAAAKRGLHLPIIINKEIKCFRFYHGAVCPPQGCPSCICLKTGRPVNFEMFEPHLDKHIEIRAIPRFNHQRKVIGLIHIVRDISQRKQCEERIRSSERELKNLAAHLIAVREEERQHIAREIHDELAQTLATIKLELANLINKLLPNQESLHDISKSIAEELDSALMTVQKIAADLRPQLLDNLGLIVAIKRYVRRLHELSKVEYELSLDFQEEHIGKKYVINIFRIIQEVLSNVIRHAHATKVSLIIKEKKEKLIIIVKDNGIGITREQIVSSNSLGLIGLRERVFMCDGRLHISGDARKGTRLFVCIPLISLTTHNTMTCDKPTFIKGNYQ